MAEIKSALVIGGGIAGPVAALALRKAGIAATVYEAHNAAAIDHPSPLFSVTMYW